MMPIHPVGKALGLLGFRLISKELGIMMLEHAGTRTGRNDYWIVFGKGSELLPGNGFGLHRKTRIVGGLSTARLSPWENHLHPFSLQQLDACHTGLRVTKVDETGAKVIHLIGTLMHDSPPAAHCWGLPRLLLSTRD
jgi:hypothetical protein